MQPKTDTRLARFVAAFASLAAGLIHVAVAPAHWQGWFVFGGFFLGLAGFQLVWAGAVVRVPRLWVASIGLVANLAAIALWGVSRVWGVPVGPDAGVPAALGASGVLTVLLESVVVVTALWFLLPREQPAVLATGAYRLTVAGAAVVMAALMVPGVVAALDHGHEGSAAHSGAGGQSKTATHGSPGHHQDAPTSGAPSTSTKTSPIPTRAEGDGHEHSHQVY